MQLMQLDHQLIKNLSESSGMQFTILKISQNPVKPYNFLNLSICKFFPVISYFYQRQLIYINCLCFYYYFIIIVESKYNGYRGKRRMRPFKLFSVALLAPLKYAYFIEKTTKSVEKSLLWPLI
jgi:hypothetical protein